MSTHRKYDVENHYERGEEMITSYSDEGLCPPEPDPVESLWERMSVSMVNSAFEKTETKEFLPQDDFERIFLYNARDPDGRYNHVLQLMGIQPCNASEHDRGLADYILRYAQRIFLIAIWIQLEQIRTAMELFKDAHFKDEDLPLEEWSGQQLKLKLNHHKFVRIEESLRRHSGRIWKMRFISEFQTSQWRFLAPKISTNVQNRYFDNGCPIPFVAKSTKQCSGAHGIVNKYTIHHAHFENSFRPNESAPYAVAVKTFRKGANVADDVRREVNALARMNQLEEKHIVLFMTSFQRGTQESLEYYVLFEWADGGNLSDFWKHYDLERTASLMKWVMEQLCGLAKALSRAHNLENGASYRHGDIKPGNILWFRGGAQSGEYGIFKIGDWGEAKIHEETTALRHGDTTAKYGSRRYEPPETGLQSLLPEGSRHVRSRLYDVWGMGCIMLEFTIWLLYGYGELCTFNNSNLGYFGPSYMFYEISGERVVRIHRVVERWMKHMSNDPLCSPGVTALGDLLQVVRTGLLVVKLPEDVNPKPQTNVELPSNRHKNSPSISITESNPIDLVVAHGPTAEQGTRFRATTLKTSLLRILEKGADERYWGQGQKPRPAPVETAGSSDLLAPPTSRKSHAAGLRAPPYDMTDYAHPSLDPEEWEFVLDNKFVAELWSQLRNTTTVPPHQAASSARLCDVCRDFEARLPDAKFAITYETQTLRLNADDERCNLCPLLWRACGDKIQGQCERVQFQRVGSTVRMTGTKHPVLTVLRSDDTGSRALDVQIGLPELPEAGTELHFGLIRGWLHDCDTAHSTPTCKPSKDTRLTATTSSKLPTRLIDVGKNGEDIVKLQKMRAEDTDDWIALSYRWGDSPPFSTTRQNLSCHIDGMMLATLPRTFQDAIKVTRALGRKYLWIDSICIIQGEDGDFRHESKRMEDVYSGAYCVLAASCATDQRSGFLFPRVERGYVALNPNQGGIGGLLYACSMIEDFRGHVLKGALHKRGWVLQEHALARRTVFFTEHQTYWECGHGVRCETMVKMKNQSAALLGDPEFPKILDPAKYGERILRFQELYRQYSRLDLSSDYDRPTAIGGLQQRLLRTMGVQGGFGVFYDPNKSSLLHRSLLWRRGDDTESLEKIAFPSDRERVPSWSWMSVSGGIDYFTLKWRHYDWQVIQSPWSHSSGRTPNGFDGQLQSLCRSNAKADEDKIVFDNATYSELPDAMAIVLGIEKMCESMEDKKHYILVVRPKAVSSADGIKLYERIGAGHIPGRCLKGSSQTCTLV